MKEFDFIFNCEPISLNSTERFFKGRVTKSKKYNTFRTRLWPLLSAYRETFQEIAKTFIHGTHSFTVAYTFGIPEEKFFTKKNTINKKAGDVDNLIKPINDLLFKSIEIFNKDIDDGLVLTVGARKIPSKNYFIAVKISLDTYENIVYG